MDDIVTSVARESHLVFWARQISEHALFLELALVGPKLRQAASRLREQWEDFRRRLPEDDPGYDDDAARRRALELIAPAKRFLLALLRIVTECTNNTPEDSNWIGWVMPSLLEHMLRETNYAIAKIRGVRLTKLQELGFWAIENHEHLEMLRKQVDPTELELNRMLWELSSRTRPGEICETQAFIEVSQRNIREINNFALRTRAALASGNLVRGMVHPLLLTHEIREGARSLVALRKVARAIRPEQPVRCADVRIPSPDFFDDFSQEECNKRPPGTPPVLPSPSTPNDRLMFVPTVIPTENNSALGQNRARPPPGPGCGCNGH